MSCAHRILFTTLLYSIAQICIAQDRCATVKYEELRNLNNPKKETTQQFENWIRQKVTLRPMEARRTEETQSTYEVPVVIHIIHNGEAEGTGINLSVAQIQSQIDVLNKDFQRLNIDAANTPAAFLPFAGSVDIQFVLAKQDPIGAPTTGIVRVKGTQSGWTVNDNAIFKALSYWPAEKYLNIWVVKFTDKTLGYAQLPVSSLPTLSDSPTDRLTDGVAISSTAFGSIDDGPFALDAKYNKGRTTTHEIGHFFGLYHIWGDDGGACSGSDYVDDTPNQAGSYINQCPTGTRASCSSDDMYMNYMDYTDDACMNMLTVGQVARINVVMQNSPRRVTLLNSIGAQAPPTLAIDAAIKQILSPGRSACEGIFNPSIEIQNLGTNPITSVRVQLKVNNTIVQTNDVAITLSNLEVGEIQFAELATNSNSLSFMFEILQVNGVTDGRSFNNVASITTTIPPLVSIPISENLNSIPSNWTIYNPDNLITWSLINTISNGNALHLESYNYDNQGALDQFISPVLDLTNVTYAYLKFDRAYEYYGTGYEDRLRVLISESCDFNNSPTIAFDKNGLELSTTSTSTGDFFSPTATQWKTEIISLSQFIGKKIQISFEAINGYGNNQYLDNIVVATDEFIDLAMISLDSPSPVSCNVNSTPVIRVKNLGTTPITNFNVQITLNSQAPLTQTITNLDIQPGSEQTVPLNSLILQAGLNSIMISLTDPNNLNDSNTNNNTFTYTRIVNSSKDIIPLRENFEGAFTSQWSIVSQGQQEVWTPAKTNQGTSLAFTAFNNPNLGEESWLVSPVLDLSRALEASLFFDNSYAANANGNDRLEVLYSEDCGATFNSILFSKSGESLSTYYSNASWIPSEEGDWRRNYINLNSLVGKSNLRFAFVATAENGNNQYLDNIEFFIDDNEEPLAIEESYSVYGEADKDLRITFNLAERQPVDLRIYNMTGQLILHNTLPEVLNQTYYLDIGYQSPGIYIIKVQFGNSISARRIYFSN